MSPYTYGSETFSAFNLSLLDGCRRKFKDYVLLFMEALIYPRNGFEGLVAHQVHAKRVILSNSTDQSFGTALQINHTK